ncbi:MAG: hypothetical protein HYY32_04960 [Chloroflexi bacterium]|nr:hypothetical protein [Chloroflexota bacterium]
MITGVVFTGLGHGISSPAANNACIELMPDRIATITGVRSTFRKAGQAVGIAVAALVLDLSGNLLLGFRYVFIGAALVTLITLPSIFAMPRSPCDVPRDIRA